MKSNSPVTYRRPANHILVGLLLAGGLLINSPTFAGEVQLEEGTEIPVYTLRQGETVARLAPSAGANLFSIRIGGVEYLRQPQSLKDLPGFAFGNPVLYPTPNRVKDSRFEFDGRVVRFQPNAGKNFLHGLVGRHVWQVTATRHDRLSASIQCEAEFGEGTELHALFPFPHRLRLTVLVRERTVRWTYEVDNQAGQRPVPFGFALHPYFVYQGSRKATFLTIPATHWMESDQQLPSGKLVSAENSKIPLGRAHSLEGTQYDDVFWGMRPEHPTWIEFRDVHREVSIRTSDEFTHLVVWTPDRRYFGVENQTCSTDAHNLHSQGFQEAAHLQICPPGKSLSGWVEYTFKQRL